MQCFLGEGERGRGKGGRGVEAAAAGWWRGGGVQMGRRGKGIKMGEQQGMWSRGRRYLQGARCGVQFHTWPDWTWLIVVGR
jgi:hypothetical protein